MKRRLMATIVLFTASGSLFAASLPAPRGPVRTLDLGNPNIGLRVHREGEVWLSVTNLGVFGNLGADQNDSGEDPCPPGNWAPQAEYPGGSGQQYLYQGALWIGALITEDGFRTPRVSVGADGWFFVQEMYPGEGDEHGIGERSNVPGKTHCFGEDVYDPQARANEEFVAVYSDTLVDPFWMEEDPVDGPHRPLGIEVTQTSMEWSGQEFDDFVVFEYRVRNIGSALLQNVYLGLYVDGDVGMGDEYNRHTDDITGFLAVDTLTGDTMRIAYIADNDGRQYGGQPVTHPHVSGMYVLETPQQDLKWSYNWWVPNGAQILDGGPAWVGNGWHTPVGDSAKYTLLSNGEWDYDQIYFNSNGYIQTHPQLYRDPCNGQEQWKTWQIPALENRADIANGYDTRYLISCGPLGIFDHVDPDGSCVYRLNPGEEFTLTVAYVFGQYFHDPANPQPDPQNIDPSLFDFSGLLNHARNARFLFEQSYAYQPPVPPRVPRPLSGENGVVPLAWTPPVIGTAAGYNIVGIDEDGIEVPFTTQPVPDTLFTAAGLTNGDDWRFRVQAVDAGGYTSEFADTLVRVGAPLPVTGVTADVDSSAIHLSWHANADPLLTGYRVLRRSQVGDSVSFATAATNYTDLTALTGNIYTYWVLAENSRNLRSLPSAPVRAIPWDPMRRILVIDDTDDLHSPADLLRGGIAGDSVAALYARLLGASGQEYDVLQQPDEGYGELLFDFQMLSQYDVVIWHAEDNRVVTPNWNRIVQREEILRTYAEAGGKLLRVGRRYLSGKMNLCCGVMHSEAPAVALLEPLEFDSVFAAPQFLAASPLPRMQFSGAAAMDPAFPSFALDTAKTRALRFQSITGLDYLPETDVLWPEGGTLPLYRSVVLPGDTSGLENQPVGVIGHNQILLAFPLYFLHEADAQALLDAAIQALRTYNFDAPEPPTVPLPVTSKLEQNYPNPFNPSTQLKFTAGAAGKFKLAIYNLLGQEVSVLVDQPLVRESYQYTWDGRSRSGQALPSGVYLARLQAPDGVSTVKLMLLR